MQGDYPVRISSQETSFRQTVTGAGVTTTSETFSTNGLPRAFLYFNQTSAGAAGGVAVDIAYRMDATGIAPEWLFHSNNILVPGGLAPTMLYLQTGAIFIRTRTTLGIGETVELAGAAFV